MKQGNHSGKTPPSERPHPSDDRRRHAQRHYRASGIYPHRDDPASAASAGSDHGTCAGADRRAGGGLVGRRLRWAGVRRLQPDPGMGVRRGGPDAVLPQSADQRPAAHFIPAGSLRGVSLAEKALSGRTGTR